MRATIGTIEFIDLLKSQGYVPSVVEPILRHGMWAVKYGHWKQQRMLLQPLPDREVLSDFVQNLKPITVWTTGEGGNIASTFRRVCTDGYFHLMPPPNIRTHQSSYDTTELDITNYELVSDWLDLAKPNVVAHAAAVVGTERVQANEDRAREVNLAASLNLFKECQKRGIMMIYFSSTCIYDPDDIQPYAEDSSIDPQTLYGQLKWAAETQLTNMMDPQLYMVVRPCFSYGGPIDRQSQLARFVRATRYNEPNISITLDPDNKKDWMRIEDVATGVDTAIRALMYHPDPPKVLNIALGEARQTQEFFVNLVDFLAEKSPNQTPIVNWERERDYLGNHQVSSQELQSWGWIPRYQGDRGFRNGLSQYVDEIFAGPELTTDFTALRG